MKVFDTSDIREIDAYTIANEPVSPIDLMERAARACATWIQAHIPINTTVAVFTGPGNNGGDGWAIARLLADQGFENLRLFHLQVNHRLSAETEMNSRRLEKQAKVSIHAITTADGFPILEKSTVIIDALFGSGLKRSLEGFPADLVKHLNSSGCRIISIDIPSGLFGEDNTGNSPEHIVKASDTLTFQFPKRSFFFAENECYTGSWHVLPIQLHPEVIAEKSTPYQYITARDIRANIKVRKNFSHKGTYGHSLLIAGSYGMMGAAILAAKACLRTGTGLLTTHIPHAGYPIIQIAVPESVFSVDAAEECFSHCPPLDMYSAIGAGPGMGTSNSTVTAFKTLIKQCQRPLVLDADALNVLSMHPELLPMLPANTILTPHPGEFDRLAGITANAFARNQLQLSFSQKFNVIVILKGCYTSISFPNGNCFFNSTGNPGMATAGSGDVLTGMLLSLLAQGYHAEEAAVIGVFLHGLAGDLAVKITGQQALLASDIINNIGNAFITLKQHEIPDN